MVEKKQIAAFDFDGTLISRDSLFIVARHILGRRKMLKAIVRTLPAILRWKLKLGVSNSQAKEKLISNFYKGMPIDTLTRAGYELGPTFNSLIRRDVIQHLEMHRAAGHTLVIVTASIGEWIRPWALEKGISAVLATEAEVDSAGRLTGRFSTPNCYGQEKVHRFLDHFPNRDSYTLWAYGDSSGDEPLLSISDHPVRCKENIQPLSTDSAHH